MATATDEKTTPEKPESRALAPFKGMRDVMAAYPKERYHLLLPTTFVGTSTLFIPTPSLVTIDPEDEGDVYPMPGSRKKFHELGAEDKVCFHAQALNRIANAAGIDFDPTLKVHDHDLKNEPLVCRTTAAGWYIDSLGQRRLLAKGVTHDLRDGSQRASLLSRQGDTALTVARQFICEQSETRAMSRVIRFIANLRGSYKKSDLMFLDQVEQDGKQVTVRRPKPFVAIRFRLDENDPDVKKALIEQATGQARRVFGGTLELEAGDAPKSDQLEDLEGEYVEHRGSSSEAERGAPGAEVDGSGPSSGSAPAEPDPVDEDDPAPAKPAVDADRAAAIRGHVEKLRSDLKWGKEAREARPSEKQVGLAATVIAKAIAGEPKRLSSEQQKELRRAVLEFLWGSFGEYAELSQDRVSVVIDFAKQFPAEVNEAVEFIAQTNPRIATIIVGLRNQMTLDGVGR